MTRLVSERYRSIDTLELTNKIGEHITSTLDMNVEAEIKHFGKNKELATFKLNDLRTDDFGGIVPHIKFFNSHDGTSSARFQVGFERLICSNGCTITQNEFEHKIIHLKGDATEHAIEQIPAAMSGAVKYITEELYPYLDALQTTVVTNEQMSLIANSLTLPKKVKERVVEAAESNRFRPTYDQDNSLFSLYNFTNEYIRKGRRASPVSCEKYEKNLLNDIVKAAENLQLVV